MKKLILAATLMASCASAWALVVADVQLEDKVSVSGTELTLNGAGVRKKFGLAKVYVAGLYLPAKASSADAVIAAKQPRRVLMVMKRGLEARQMLDAFHDGLKSNLSAAELDALKPQLTKLDAIFGAIKEAREGDRIALDVGADGGVKVLYNGQLKDAIAGPDIGPALLKIWLGKKPVQDDLKQDMLKG